MIIPLNTTSPFSISGCLDKLCFARCFISVPDQPVVTVQRIDSTSVNVSWTLKTGHEDINFFLVRYRKILDSADNYHTINTTKTYIKITGLEPDVKYEIVVS